MRFSKELEKWRIREGPYATPDNVQWGKFYIPGPCNVMLQVIASCGGKDMGVEWDHVSVSLGNRCPNWIEMCFIKDLFWNEEETVIQFHPPKSQYVNNHPYCLHLWKPHNLEIPLPPRETVG